MLIDSKNFRDVSMNDVMTPAMRAIWDHMSIGVAIVDGKGICVYMNEIQARVDGFTTSGVVGKHITELYVPNGMARIPTMECLYRGEPLLRKAYWYKTINNSLFSSVTDFYPLFDHGMKDGVLAFTIWVDSALLTGEAKMNTRAPASASDSTRYTFESIIGHDPALRGAVSDAKVAAKSPVPVMIWERTARARNCLRRRFMRQVREEIIRSLRSTARPFRKICWKAYCSAPRREPTPTPRTSPDFLKRPTAEPCCSTNSTPCLWAFRQAAARASGKKNTPPRRQLGKGRRRPGHQHSERAPAHGREPRHSAQRPLLPPRVVGIAVPPLRNGWKTFRCSSLRFFSAPKTLPPACAFPTPS